MKRIISLLSVTVLIIIFSCNQGRGNKEEVHLQVIQHQ